MNSEKSELIPWEESQPPTRMELLTTQFYAWELRGRGWQIWDAPVDIEPPFRPFYFDLPANYVTIPDDAHKPTALSRFADRIIGIFTPAEATESVEALIETPLPEPIPFLSLSGSPIVEFQVSVPPTLKVSADAAEQFLLSLAYTSSPVAFEIVGTEDTIEIQLACRENDHELVSQQLQAHFPDAAVEYLRSNLTKRWRQNMRSEPVIIDFGLAQEFMRPLRMFSGFTADPLSAIVGSLSGLRSGEIGILQILFQAAQQDWTESVLRAVTDYRGGSFFIDAPEMVSLARAKVERPLFSSVVRVAAQSQVRERSWEIVRFLGGALKQFSKPPSNELIPLANNGYPDEVHETDLLLRQSHRSGMILSSGELVSLAHLPSASVSGEKLVRRRRTTKGAPEAVVGNQFILGENLHGGKTSTVSLSTDQRTRHTYLVGSTGTGKSHLLANLIIQDLRAGKGIGVLDPHGDLIDQILGYVPEERVDDVVLFDPSDEERPVGFNLLEAHSVLEKNLLASDMTAAFRRLSTSWGDQMTAVLSNAVLAFLESEAGGTLAELRRFLVDAQYRRSFLSTVRDPEVVYFWQKEFSLLSGRPQAPILTRLNAFLRHPLVRHVVAQREARLDLGAAMREGKIFLGKLAQGAIGEENAHLLGSLIVSKFQQMAMARQEVRPEERLPFYLYIDEFHNFATPSMAQILAGARKYRLGLVLAHQDLEQLRGQEGLLNAVLSNPAVRICFRVGERDAKKLAEGFSAFTGDDLQVLGTGEAVCRIERSDWDFNLKVPPLPPSDSIQGAERSSQVVARSREHFGVSKAEIDSALESLREAPETASDTLDRPVVYEQPERVKEALTEADIVEKRGSEDKVDTLPVEPPPLPLLGRGGPEHIYLQNLIKRWAENRGWRATIEKDVLDGSGNVDVSLERENLSIACEISVNSTPEQELGNVRKCLEAGYDEVAIISTATTTLNRVREKIESELNDEETSNVFFLSPEELFVLLEEREAESSATEGTVRGYKVKTRYRAIEEEEKQTRKQAVSQVILKAVKRMRGRT